MSADRFVLSLAVASCAACSAASESADRPGDADPVRTEAAGETVNVDGFRVPMALSSHRTHAGRPTHSTTIQDPASPVVLGTFGCADVMTYSDIPNLPGSSQQLFSGMVGGICGQWNFLTSSWFGGHCTAQCSGTGDWCAELEVGVLVQSSDPCNSCAIAPDVPGPGAYTEIANCANDPNNIAP